MLRITNIQDANLSTTLKLEGKLLEPWIAELEAACRGASRRATSTTIDLSGTTFVDSAGATALKTLRRRGMQLVGCSPLVTELIGKMEPQT